MLGGSNDVLGAVGEESEKKICGHMTEDEEEE